MPGPHQSGGFRLGLPANQELAAKSVGEGKEEQLTYPVLEVRAVSLQDA